MTQIRIIRDAFRLELYKMARSMELLLHLLEPKATANLDGTINYVWPDPSGENSFDIQYLLLVDFDISARFCNSPTVGNMNIVTTTPWAAAAIHYTTASCGGETIISGEIEPRDDFDASSDAHFLYVVLGTLADGSQERHLMQWRCRLGSNTPTIGPFLVGQGASADHSGRGCKE